MIRPTAIPATFENQTGLFRCEPCNTGAVAPAPERGGYAWQRTKLPDTPYQLRPLTDSAPPPAAGADMSEIDERIRGEAATAGSVRDRESPLLWGAVLALSGFCLYCKVADGKVIPQTAAAQEQSIAEYQKRMREAKAANPEREQRPAIRIPDMKRKAERGAARP
jgi:hypothetical protein